MAIAPYRPTHRHWSAFDEFLKHWDVSREEIAFICDCSLTTVNHWFSQGEHQRIPTDRHKQRLALAHHVWIKVESEPEYLQTLRQMYRQKSRRKPQ